MSRRSLPTSQDQHESRRAVILAWQSDLEQAQFGSSPAHPPKRKVRGPLTDMDPNPVVRPRRKKTRNTKEKTQKEVEPDADIDSTPRAELPPSSRTDSPLESPTRLPGRGQQQRQRVGTRTGLDGTAEEDIVPELLTRESSYVTSLRFDMPSRSEPSVSTGSRKSSRASSPVKKKADLRLSKTELDYKGSIQNAEDDLPQDVHDLCEKLDAICHGSGIVPPETKHLFSRKERLYPHMVRTASESSDSAALVEEFRAIEAILQRSLDCLRREKHEPAWNEEVHRPVLDLAFFPSREKHVSVDNVTLAQISPDFVPEAAYSQKSGMQSKMIDYTINLILPELCSSALYHYFASLPYNQHSLNQTIYTAIRERPVAVSIEAKVDNPSDPTTQLAIWTLAWHRRVRHLIRDARIVTLPLITIGKDGWKVSFFCDCGDKVEFWDFPDAIGHTKTVIGIYTLLAALRAIEEWIATTYKSWFWETVWPAIPTTVRGP